MGRVREVDPGKSRRPAAEPAPVSRLPFCVNGDPNCPSLTQALRFCVISSLESQQNT